MTTPCLYYITLDTCSRLKSINWLDTITVAFEQKRGKVQLRWILCPIGTSAIVPLFRHDYPHQLGALFSLVSLLKPTHFTGMLLISSAVGWPYCQQVFGKSRESAIINMLLKRPSTSPKSGRLILVLVTHSPIIPLSTSRPFEPSIQMDDRERKKRRLSTTNTNAIPVTSTGYVGSENLTCQVAPSIWIQWTGQPCSPAPQLQMCPVGCSTTRKGIKPWIHLTVVRCVCALIPRWLAVNHWKFTQMLGDLSRTRCALVWQWVRLLTL